MNDEQRPGEIALPFDPAVTAKDGSITFLGRIRTDWKSRADCPKNMVQARERGHPAQIEVDDPWRAGLAGLGAHRFAIILYWMDQARRDLIVQKPHHRSDPAGVFALRSPVRPNPISLAVVRLLNVDEAAGRVTVDAIDCLDGTPLVDIKPWYASVDIPTSEDATA